MATPIVEEYLEAIYKLQGAGKALGTTELGKELRVSAASASEMTDRLVQRGLAEKMKDTGIRLTRKGQRAALELIRRHRLSERFLVDVLGMDWKDVHDEACRLEHAIFSRGGVPPGEAAGKSRHLPARASYPGPPGADV